MEGWRGIDCMGEAERRCRRRVVGGSQWQWQRLGVSEVVRFGVSAVAAAMEQIDFFDMMHRGQSMDSSCS